MLLSVCCAAVSNHAAVMQPHTQRDSSSRTGWLAVITNAVQSCKLGHASFGEIPATSTMLICTILQPILLWWTATLDEAFTAAASNCTQLRPDPH